MMKPFFLSVFEFIKKRNFEVWVPAFYHPFMPVHLKNPDRSPLPQVNRWKMVPTRRIHPAPFRQVIDPAQMQRAAFSIEIMLDMFQKKVEFELYEEEDIVEIFDGLDRYLVAVRNDIGFGNADTLEYVKLVLRWREQVYKNYYRYMQNNPVVKDKLYPNNNPTKNLMHVMGLAGGITAAGEEADPLYQKSFPPYDVSDITPREPGDTPLSPDQMMESSLGLSSERPKVDTGKGFDFDEFTKRRP